MHNGSSHSERSMNQEVLQHVATFFRQERQILLTIIMYALAVGLFSLIIPLTVQELVNTFAFAIQPIMVVTLVSIMAGILLFVGIFKALQFFATDLLERRIFVRFTLAFARTFPSIQETQFRSEYASRFFEIIFMQRAVAALLVDLTNVAVGGVIGMTLLALYHPYFLFFDLLLLLAVGVIGILGHGGLRATLHMSEAKYDTYHWFQEIADNLSHFKSSLSRDLILQKADSLAHTYVHTRQSRFRILVRQYIGSLLLQVILHTGLLGTAGWLMSKGQLTLGQLVAAEVIIASLLLNLESVIKRTYVIFYFLTALTEIHHIFSLPKDQRPTTQFVQLPATGSPQGLALSLSHVRGLPPPWPPTLELNMDLAPSEKWAIVCVTESQRLTVSRLLAGLDHPPQGSIRYNGIDVRDLHPDEINGVRGLVLSRHMTLFEATLMENVTLRRKNLATEDLLWVLDLVGLQEEIEHIPDGLQGMVQYGGKNFSPSQTIQILLARALIARPKLVIIDGGLHEIFASRRESILNAICDTKYPWTVVIVTTDSNIKKFVQQSIVLE
ncbi:ATP-binding cassette domain-containing protein [Candidatus Nitrospira allomarina]|uniref:ATP-binding cassette domain-containing protein n=1 Tax=Candidatus Nitrospira allomarina TaxID=3020900 RepID=A0AA96JZ06_9BACT|nr:ATP-binding cassette domain-containing protein [Candidatus Nitrospira allomarina]WNM58109.1 ATP-binding cassette domain-containing protein [Candidatus Nitrospira allomarina]